MECLYNFINPKEYALIYTAFFLTYNNNNKNYIITITGKENDPMTIYDFNGYIIKIIFYSSQKLFIDAFQDNKDEIFYVSSDYKIHFLMIILDM